MTVYSGDMKDAALAIIVPADLKAPIIFRVTPLDDPDLPPLPWTLHVTSDLGPANHRAQGLLAEMRHRDCGPTGDVVIYTPWTDPKARELARALMNTGWVVESNPAWEKAKLILAARGTPPSKAPATQLREAGEG